MHSTCPFKRHERIDPTASAVLDFFGPGTEATRDGMKYYKDHALLLLAARSCLVAGREIHVFPDLTVLFGGFLPSPGEFRAAFWIRVEVSAAAGLPRPSMDGLLSEVSGTVPRWAAE